MNRREWNPSPMFGLREPVPIFRDLIADIPASMIQGGYDFSWRIAVDDLIVYANDAQP